MVNSIVQKIRERFARRSGSNEIRIRRQIAIRGFIWHRLSFLTSLLFTIGYLWITLLPLSELGQGIYIDENALQPGQVTTYWNWADVHRADQHLKLLETLRDRNATSKERADTFASEFMKLGLTVSTQNYTYHITNGLLEGTNAYAVFSSPRASGTEAIIISASWRSLTSDLNLRGVATVLSLAAFFKHYSLWAKDLIFVISDGYLDGMHAWLSSHYGIRQSNLEADDLSLTCGVIWTALNIDYPGHSFSHLGLFFEGLNGRLPNQDLLNSIHHISQYTAGVPVVLYDHLSPRERNYVPSWIPEIARIPKVQEYAYRATNILRHAGYQMSGQASGVHGLLHRFRIDAVTLFAVPAMGPHGFHSIGRIVESTLRTCNNLLERLHASFFFYLLATPESFLKIGKYLPGSVLISAAMMFGGLGVWIDAGWVRVQNSHETSDEKSTKTIKTAKWVTRPRPVLPSLGLALCTHTLGIVLFFVISRAWFVNNQKILSPLIVVAMSVFAPAALFILPSSSGTSAPYSLVLKAINLCLASTVVSIVSVLNFSLSALLAMLLGVPLAMSNPSRNATMRLGKYSFYMLLGLGWILFAQDEVRKAVWNWEVLGVWFAPFGCMVYTPLMLQAAFVCLLPK